MTTIEVTGWNLEGESVEASDPYVSADADEDAEVQRICARWGIVEIGDVHVYNVERVHPLEREHDRAAS